MPRGALASETLVPACGDWQENIISHAQSRGFHRRGAASFHEHFLGLESKRLPISSQYGGVDALNHFAVGSRPAVGSGRHSRNIDTFFQDVKTSFAKKKKEESTVEQAEEAIGLKTPEQTPGQKAEGALVKVGEKEAEGGPTPEDECAGLSQEDCAIKLMERIMKCEESSGTVTDEQVQACSKMHDDFAAKEMEIEDEFMNVFYGDKCKSRFSTPAGCKDNDKIQLAWAYATAQHMKNGAAARKEMLERIKALQK